MHRYWAYGIALVTVNLLLLGCTLGNIYYILSHISPWMVVIGFFTYIILFMASVIVCYRDFTGFHAIVLMAAGTNLFYSHVWFFINIAVIIMIPVACRLTRKVERFTRRHDA